jgi:hypothetical protein
MRNLNQLIGPFVLVLSLSLSCAPKDKGMVTYDHALFSITYPGNWVKRDLEGSLMALTKYSDIEGALMRDNASLIGAAKDSADLAAVGISSFEDFIAAFSTILDIKENVELEQDFQDVTINGSTFQFALYKIKGENALMLQSVYFSKNRDKYLFFIVTQKYDRPNKELNSIIKSLKITEYESMEDLLDVIK